MWGVSSHYASALQPWTTRIREITGTETRLSAKIAGGANLFPNTGPNALDIGAKNVRAVKATLTHHEIRLIGEDVGGSHGRKVTFNITTGTTVVRLHNGEIRKL